MKTTVSYNMIAYFAHVGISRWFFFLCSRKTAYCFKKREFLRKEEVKAYYLDEIMDFKHCFLEASQLAQLIEDLKGVRILEVGMYREEVMHMLKVGERKMVTLDAAGILKPKEILFLKDGRKRYMYDQDEVVKVMKRCI
jgi:hypothetical protein